MLVLATVRVKGGPLGETPSENAAGFLDVRFARGFRADGVVVTHSFADAKLIATGDALRRFATDIAVIGGAEIYAQWMDSADRLEITEVHARPDGDTHFPAVDPTAWEEAARVRNPAGSHDSADFSYVTFRRRRKR